MKKEGWYKTIWEITNVLPGAYLEKNIAAFPEQLPYRLIKLYSYFGETVLDPFLGSGTTMKVARLLKRNSIGIEILKDLLEVIKIKTGFKGKHSGEPDDDSLEIIERSSGKYRFATSEYLNKRKSENQNGN